MAQNIFKFSKMEKKYAKFLKNKKVVLVGPAWHTKNTRQREKIEAYDIVVRMNLGFKIPRKVRNDIGQKTDVLYCSFSKYFYKEKIFSSRIIKKMKNELNTKWIIGTGHHKGMMEKICSNIQDINLFIVDRTEFKYIKSQFKGKVTTGLITIYDLLQYDIKELYITGFTFYNFILKGTGKKKLYFSSYMPGHKSRPGVVLKHDNKGQLSFFKKLYKKDKRIKCDEILTDIIHSKGRIEFKKYKS